MRLEDYMKELQSVELLEPDEEAALWRAYKSGGDMVARRRIIESYQPLVFKQAMPYRALPGIMDVIQEGTVGLIEAVERYDPARGVDPICSEAKCVSDPVYAALSRRHSL